MPRKNLGLTYELTRYHRIGSPSDRLRVESDRPLECALCHPGEGAGALVDTIERWWGKRYDRGALTRLYGDLRTPVLQATVKRGLPHEQATALAVLGEQRVAAAEPLIAGQLVHDYPLVRYFARRALERLGGAPIALDVEQPLPALRAAVVARWPRAALAPARPTGAPPANAHGED
jgi:hypothetical protein